MWTCSKCGEHIEADYEVCWACGTSVDGVEDPEFSLSDMAPPQTPPAPMPSPEIADRLVTIARCTLPAQAVAMRLHLEAEGIAAFLADEFTVVMDWLLSNAIGGVKLQVAEPDAVRACELLHIDVPDELLAEQEDETEDESEDEDLDAESSEDESTDDESHESDEGFEEKSEGDEREFEEDELNEDDAGADGPGKK